MTWAAIVTGGSPKLYEFGDPDLTIQTRIFPPVSNNGYVPLTMVPPVLQPVEDGSSGYIVKAFVFSHVNISRLQNLARSNSVPNPTRIESVTCHIWKHLMAAAATTRLGSSSSRVARQESVPTATAVIHSVNMRPHLRPALPPTSFGKFVTHAFANSKNEEGGTQTRCELVVSLRQAFLKAKDNEWLNKFQGEGRIEAALHHKKTLEEFLPKSYFFTSLTGLDQVNFGSGDPVWIGLTGGKPSSYFKNYIPLIHTSGRRIEAWVILDEREMEVFESDQEFLAYAIPSNVAPFTFISKASL